MRHTALLLFFLVFSVAGLAQKSIEGLWEGKMTFGGITSEEGYDFALYLKLNGRKVSGHSTITLEDGKTIDMEVNGILYHDQSIYMTDVKFMPIEGVSAAPPFNRKYQLIYHRSIFGSTLDGWWQEVRDKKIMDEKRPRGRIFLKKVKKSQKA